jgi:hypothetical protein
MVDGDCCCHRCHCFFINFELVAMHGRS